jgi:hypothetical protein
MEGVTTQSQSPQRLNQQAHKRKVNPNLFTSHPAKSVGEVHFSGHPQAQPKSRRNCDASQFAGARQHFYRSIGLCECEGTYEQIKGQPNREASHRLLIRTVQFSPSGNCAQNLEESGHGRQGKASRVTDKVNGHLAPLQR